MNKGTLTILACAVVAVVAFSLHAFGLSGRYDVFYYIGFAGLIGSFTNKMAIDAMFSPWPSQSFRLPYTGIIERKRDEIIEGIAVAVSEQIMGPAAVTGWMAESNFLESLRDSAADWVHGLRQTDGDPGKLRSRMVDSLRQDAIRFLDSDDAFCAVRSLAEKGVQDFLEEKGGLAMQFGQMIGPADHEVMTHSILTGVKTKVEKVLNHEDGSPSPELCSFIETVGGRLEGWDVRSEPVAQQFASVAAEKFDVRGIVTRSLGRYSAVDVKELLVSLSRHHLTWLEVYGGVFGAVGGLLMWLLSGGLP